MYLLGEFDEKFELNSLKNEFHTWVNELVKEFYPNEKRIIISFGFIRSPQNSSRDQPWHVDYSPNFSNLFVPMCELSIKNATQFIRGPMSRIEPNSEGSYNLEGGPNELRRRVGKNWLEVSQVVCKSFMILKMHCAVVHRGKIYVISKNSAKSLLLSCDHRVPVPLL